MPTKKAKPEVFGDKHRRCVVSSIAGYEEHTDGNVSIFLKSGESVILQFNNEYLSGKATERLDEYFAVDTPETNPCNVCVNKGKAVPKPTQYDKTFCCRCYSKRENFKSPEEKEEVKNE